jgi:hypothetical protein
MRWRRRTAAGGTPANPSLSARTREARVRGLRLFLRKCAGERFRIGAHGPRRAGLPCPPARRVAFSAEGAERVPASRLARAYVTRTTQPTEPNPHGGEAGRKEEYR